MSDCAIRGLVSKLVARISESREIDKMESRGGGKLMGLIGDEVRFNRLLDCRARHVLHLI